MTTLRDDVRALVEELDEQGWADTRSPSGVPMIRRDGSPETDYGRGLVDAAARFRALLAKHERARGDERLDIRQWPWERWT